MLNSRLRSINHVSLDLKKLPSRNLEALDNTESSIFKLSEALHEPAFSRFTSAPVTAEKKVDLNLSCSQPTQPSQLSILTPTTASSPKNIFILKKRTLTKGYTQFLETKEFMSHREESRAKVEAKVRKAFAHEDTKIMSDEIQKLVSSTIINKPIHNLKELRKSMDVNSSAPKDGMPSLDERYKHICYRILGRDFENTLLFMKVQEEGALMAKHGRDPKDKFNSAIVTKKANKTASPVELTVNTTGQQVLKPRLRRKMRKAATVMPTSLTLNSVAKENSHEKVTNILEETASIKLEEEDESMNELDPGSRVPCHLNFGYSEQSSISLIPSKKSSGRTLKSISKQSFDKSYTETSRVKLDVEKKMANKENVGDSGNRQEKTVSKSRILRDKLHSLERTENTDPNVKTKNSSRIVKKAEESIDRINEISSGVIGSTHRLGARLRQQQKQVDKDFDELETKMEKFVYHNNMEDWEKSLKEVFKIQQTSPFYNLVA